MKQQGEQDRKGQENNHANTTRGKKGYATGAAMREKKRKQRPRRSGNTWTTREHY